mmetsp:Transcript_5070/g.20255  ORF Transcript_5070/g.20255 Transcript_5070/m.20255 type:complete len:216 (+) Transcript_5070:1193-1840(+)
MGSSGARRSVKTARYPSSATASSTARRPGASSIRPLTFSARVVRLMRNGTIEPIAAHVQEASVPLMTPPNKIPDEIARMTATKSRHSVLEMVQLARKKNHVHMPSSSAVLRNWSMFALKPSSRSMSSPKAFSKAARPPRRSTTALPAATNAVIAITLISSSSFSVSSSFSSSASPLRFCLDAEAFPFASRPSMYARTSFSSTCPYARALAMPGVV